jgi:hypothetical protein
MILGFQLLFICSTAMAAPAKIGTVTEVEGQVQLLRDNAFYEAGVGVEIYNTDSVLTSSDGQVQFDMVDGTNLRIGSDTRLRFSEYELDEKGNVVSAVVDVLSGWIRFAVATLQENSAYNIDTPTMTIGIRGTEGVIEAGEQNSGLFLSEGNVSIIGADSGAAETPLELVGGEYAERPSGQPIRRQAMTEQLQESRIPPRMRLRIARRMQFLKTTGVHPRRIRAANAAEVRRFLLENPQARERIRERLRKKRFSRRMLQQQRLRRMQKTRQRMNSN